MDLNEIIEANNELAKRKSELDKIPVKKNPVGGESADSHKRIAGFLPSKEEEFHAAENLTSIFDTTKRAGAGGTRTGVPGIRPHGGKAASRFLDDYTGTGRMKPEKKPFEEQVNIKEGKKLDVRKPSVVMYERCPDCMERVSRDKCVPSITIIPTPPTLNEIARAKWESVRLSPGMVLAYIFCLKCVKDASDKAVMLNRTGIDILLFDGQIVKAGQRYLKQRGERISDNVFEIIKAERANPQSDIFYDC